MIKNIMLTCALALTVGTLSFAQKQYENTKIQIGQPAPELSYPTPDGTTMSLSDVAKGRYVLLDFWASWCGPCRMSNPGLVKFYDKYKDKKYKNAPNGFVIMSVSLDKKKEAWENAIKRDNLYWPYHISDLKAWQSEAAATYGVNFIPQTFLIAPDGKVIGKFTIKQENGKMIEIADQVAEELDKYVVNPTTKQHSSSHKKSKKK